MCMLVLMVLTVALGGLASASCHAGNEDRSKSSTTSVIRVGPQHKLNRVAEAARLAKDGDVVEIEAGEYLNDVASWSQSRITIRALGGRARMRSIGDSAEGKAIWVIKGNDVTVEGIEFAGGRVPDRNGAGIRHEGGKLTLRDCLFERNEMGILTWNNEAAELEVERSEFRHNSVSPRYREGDPIGHQIYVGAIARFTLRESYVHHGAFGHLVKSRARENHIYYNRITDEVGGRSSYELEFPNGGLAYVVGNIIQQGSQTENANIIAFGAEGYTWPRNELYLGNNTLVDDWPQGGNFLRAAPGNKRIKAVNNLLIGKNRLEPAGGEEYIANHQAEWSDVALAVREDYRLKRGSKLVGKAVDPGEANGVKLRPEREYVHPTSSRLLPDGPYSPGATQSLVP